MQMINAKDSEVQCVGSGPWLKLRPFNYFQANVQARNHIPAEKMNVRAVGGYEGNVG
jgi:hypothetical protein